MKKDWETLPIPWVGGQLFFWSGFSKTINIFLSDAKNIFGTNGQTRDDFGRLCPLSFLK